MLVMEPDTGSNQPHPSIHLRVSWLQRVHAVHSWWPQCTKHHLHLLCSLGTPRSWASIGRRSLRSRKPDRAETPWPRSVFYVQYSVKDKSVCFRQTDREDKTQAFSLKNGTLTGRKLHSWVLGSYFSTTSIGDCWLPNPPITSRTSLAPERKRCDYKAHMSDMHLAKLHLKAGFLPNLACVRGPCISLRSSGLKWNFLASSTRSRQGRLHRMRGWNMWKPA